MSSRQAKQLLDCFMYHASQELRLQIMRELPEAYNAYHGRRILTVVRAEDGSEITLPS
jgi:hypothetical protein